MRRSMTAPITATTIAALAGLALMALGNAAFAQPVRWVLNKHYSLVPPQRTQVPAGKIEVMEVFSYGCPACNTFRPVMKEIERSLPKNAQIAYLPASWNAGEAWPTFQRAYLTAQALGVADKAHEALYDAIWTTGELAVLDRNTGRPVRKLPTLEDVARFYEKTTGVKTAEFLNASKSFTVDRKIRQAEDQIRAMQVDGTPTLVVNGKYRINNREVRSVADIVGLVNFLVAQESAAASRPAAARKP
jgi:protein dithiol oxidoreductase (disulfide-forming)